MIPVKKGEWGPCNGTPKRPTTAWRTVEEARAHIQKYHVDRGDPKPRHVIECVCGWYHKSGHWKVYPG